MSRPEFIAEVSSNHHTDLDRCLRFIDTAADIGCAGVKFQLFQVRDLFAPEILARSPSHRTREAWELPVEFLPTLSEHARHHGLRFGVTPFDLMAVDIASRWCDFLKVSSYELLWGDLLSACRDTGLPIVLSTGMADLDEVSAAMEVLEGAAGITLLHCVSSYPVPASSCNLGAIGSLRERFGCRVGWSDHSRDPAVVRRAVDRWGASMVEFHLDLEGQGAEYAAGHCWLPEEMAPVIAGRGGRDVPEADGTGIKAPVDAELRDREWRADPSDGLRPFLAVRRAWEAGY